MQESLRKLRWSGPMMVAIGLGMGATLSAADDRIEAAKLDDRNTIVLADAPRVLAPEVAFLPRAPEIDGHLDPELTDLSIRRFTRVWKSDPGNPMKDCHYRLAYGTDFFYVYVEAEAEGLTFRDRAFQNGDGFSLVIAVPRPDDQPTEEFYVLSCSAVDKPGLEWTRRIFWYYNVNTIFMRTGEETRLEFSAADGTIAFELFLPWKDVCPNHPWLSEEIGFNLRFVQAVGERGRNEYKVSPGTIGAENMPRWYARLRFEPPRLEEGAQTYVAPLRRNLAVGQSCRAVAATVAARPLTEQVTLEAQGRDQGATTRTEVSYACDPGLTRHELEAIGGQVPVDDYQLFWHTQQSADRGAWEVTVLPPFDADAMTARLRSARAALSPGSFTTIEFNIERAASLLAALPVYEVASDERRVLEQLEERLEQALRGEDPYAMQTGYLRRAFRSKLDQTLQPYLVRVPDDFDRGRTYPLVVYLHGSASDETDLMGHAFISRGNVIEVAPFGRGPSNGFVPEESQVDIVEAIEDVIANYPVDPGRIVLTGFSMGGYGAYRTFYAHPDRFRAVAVFSGGAHFRGESAPDFRDPQYLAPFRDMPVFVYHGEQDRNVSYAGALDVVAGLRAAGARLTFHSEPDKGHEAPGEAVIAAYHRWLDQVLERDR